MAAIDQIKKTYRLKKNEILQRLKEFKQLWNKGNNEDIFRELAFCILTPQSKAKLCWHAICTLKKKELICKANANKIRPLLNKVRFKNKKAKYIVEARKLLSSNGKMQIKNIIRKCGDVYQCREWLAKNIKGIGYKEASHFLRNIGFGEKIAILDRHILKNLKKCRVITEIPKHITRIQYIDIEQKMVEFSKKINIPLSHLDLLFWCKETGEIFK